MMKTCVIMGNGPSLLEMPADILGEMDSFGVNYAPYLPTYYACVDHDILTSHHDKIYHLVAGAKTAFLPLKEHGTSDLYNLPNVTLVRRDESNFKDERFFSGFTVVYVALKCAFYMGYERVHLWGVDHSEDWSHYKAGYPIADPNHIPARMREMEYHYRLAQEVYTVNGRRIVNHSHHSKLDAIFPRMSIII